jgi:hypothetical protein
MEIFESVHIMPNFVFCLEKLSQFQITPKHVNIFNFRFLYYKLQLYLNNIYIASHLHVVKDSWTFLKL